MISQTFERLQRQAALRTIRFHDLRHTRATVALKAGVSVNVVSERLGHTKASVTQDIYQHVIPGNARGMSRPGSLLGSTEVRSVQRSRLRPNRYSEASDGGCQAARLVPSA